MGPAGAVAVRASFLRSGTTNVPRVSVYGCANDVGRPSRPTVTCGLGTITSPMTWLNLLDFLSFFSWEGGRGDGSGEEEEELDTGERGCRGESAFLTSGLLRFLARNSNGWNIA